MAGMPSSRAMMAAWQVRPPRFVTIAAAVFMTGSQSGVVMSVIEHLAGVEVLQVGDVDDDAGAAGGDLLADGAAGR